MSSNNEPYISLSTTDTVEVTPCEKYDEIAEFELQIQPRKTLCYQSIYFRFAIFSCILIVLLVTFGLLGYNTFFRGSPSSKDVGFINSTTLAVEVTSTTLLSTILSSTTTTEPTVTGKENKSAEPEITSTTVLNSTLLNSKTTVPTVTQKEEIIKVPCSDGYIFFNQTASCYKFHRTPKTFEVAEQTCVSENGHLASIHSEQEDLVVFGIFRTGMGTSYCDLGAWIGLQYQNDSWGWTDGSFPIYKALDENTAPVEDSRAILHRDEIEWQINGEDKKMFMCKAPANVVVTNSSTRKGGCESGYTWFEHTGQCYKAFPKLMDYEEAMDTCESENAKMTSVHSEIENLFIIGLSHQVVASGQNFLPVWLGMKENREKWHDGTPMDFQNWDKSDDEWEVDATAIDIRSGKWSSNLIDIGFAVCKKN